MTSARPTLIGSALLTTVAALGGMTYALGGAESVPPEWLDGSPFSSYVIPGLVLGLVVGGSQAVAALALWEHHDRAVEVVVGASFILAAWITVQVAIIGFASALQPFCFSYAIAQFWLARRLAHESVARVG